MSVCVKQNGLERQGFSPAVGQEILGAAFL